MDLFQPISVHGASTQSRCGVRPLVSVVILYYKRREIIEQTLRSVLNQDYEKLDIILVDNHSQDDVSKIVARLGNGIRLLTMPVNAGACAGRNAGVRAACGDIIVFVDDDVCFSSENEVARVVRTFEQRPEMHVLALQVCDPHTGKVRLREWCHTRPYDAYAEEEFETVWFGEGASAFRREVFETCGLYYEPLYYGAEGHDMVVRVLDRGFRILHTPGIRVLHWASESGRSLDRQYYYFTRNFIWMACKDYRPWDGLRFLAPKLLMMAYFAARTSTYRPVLRGIRDGLTGLPAAWRDRTPISRSTLAILAEHEKWRPNVFVRFARHRAQPQI
jgi:GT2 family glycosyltransferase